MKPGLTGDPVTDRLVGPAMRLVGGVRTYDPVEIEAAFTDAAAVLDGQADAARALATVLAAFIPWNRTPNELLGWLSRGPEFERLRDAGIDPSIAADIVSGLYPDHLTAYTI